MGVTSGAGGSTAAAAGAGTGAGARTGYGAKGFCNSAIRLKNIPRGCWCRLTANSKNPLPGPERRQNDIDRRKSPALKAIRPQSIMRAANASGLGSLRDTFRMR